MVHSGAGEEEAIVPEEIQGEEDTDLDRPSRNACTLPVFPGISPRLRLTASTIVTELLKGKPKTAPGARTHQHNPFKERMGLGVYLADPTSPRIIHQTPASVCIHDMFPKATVHTLLLPRSSSHHLLHPFDALEDGEFLAQVRRDAEVLKGLAARELQRLLGKGSRSEARRQAVLDGEAAEDDGQLPPGRDWSKEIVVGIHAVPSMSHLHVHVLSRDMHSPSLKHRKHYNSFTTPFLVNLDDFPLAADDPRRRTKDEAYLNWDLRCWRCGTNFGNRFKELKEHLETEFEGWRRE